ncbi:MAG: TonB-dependent receptor [Mucilaginibacter sp.]|uniref:TonB-dependent receptor domain-containing protein n=1 Tax=Mucilaginibacter sp. TaxID=1882438 RepID=UPI0032669125
MYKILLTTFFVSIILFGQAQNRAVIKGKVIDSLSNEPMEFTTVAALNLRDTTNSLIAYTVTDKKGAFTLHNMPAGVPIKLLITFVAYQPYRKFLTLIKAQEVDLGIVHMVQKQLAQVDIVGERPPIVIRKDTIEFNAEAFKTRPNAMVEDLLKKLPGVEVDHQGNVSVNGKAISKVTVDGHDFFTNDPTIATKNLDADLIDKVQIYDDRENDPDHLIPASDVKKIINLKFKKPFRKAIFGKVYGGAGTEQRYNTGGLINMFRDTLQVSVIGQSNNLNNTGFSYNDLHELGGINRGGGSGFGNPSFGAAQINGIQKTTSTGVNINTDYGKKLKINLSYYYNHNINNFSSLTNKQQFLHDTDLVNNSITTRVNTTDRHNLSATLRWHPNDATEFTYAPGFSYTTNNSGNNTTGNSFSNYVSRLNQTFTNDSTNNHNLQFAQAISYNRQLKKSGESISISNELRVEPSGGISYNENGLTSYVSTFPSYLLSRRGNTDNRATGTGLSIAYRYPVSKKITLSISEAESYNHQVNNTATFDRDPATGNYDTFLQILSTALTRNLWTNNTNAGIAYNISEKLSFQGGFNAQYMNVNNQFDRGYADINRSYFALLPNAQLRYKQTTFSYSRSFNTPNIGDLVPYSVVFSPLYSVTGNPNLRPTRSDNYNVVYFGYNPQRQTSLSLTAHLGIDHDGIFRERTLDAFGVETSTPLNMDGRYNITGQVYFNKRFKKQHGIIFSTGTNFSLSKNHNFFELNHVDGYQNSYYISYSQNFGINWNDIIEIEPRYSLRYSRSEYTGIALNPVNNATHTADTHFNVYWPVHINWEGNYTYNYNPQVSPGFQKSSNLLSISVAHSFLKKDHGELKLSCYDILNQAIGTNRIIFENNITDTQSQIIKRYFLLTFQYRFMKSTSKADEKPKPSFNMGPMMRLM